MIVLRFHLQGILGVHCVCNCFQQSLPRWLSGLIHQPRCTLLAITSQSWVRIWTQARKVYQLRSVHAMGLNSQTGTHRWFTCVFFNLSQVAAIKFYCCLPGLDLRVSTVVQDQDQDSDAQNQDQDQGQGQIKHDTAIA